MGRPRPGGPPLQAQQLHPVRGGEVMKRHIPGLHRESQNGDDILEGLFLVQVERAFYRWHLQKPFFALRLAVLEPKEHTGQTLSGRLYCTPSSTGSCATSATTLICSAGTRSMKKLCWVCAGLSEPLAPDPTAVLS